MKLAASHLRRTFLFLSLITAILFAGDGVRPLYAFDQLLIANYDAGTIQRYDPNDTLLGEFGGPELIRPNGMRLGPDGMLYVADEIQDRVLRYNPANGNYLGIFAEDGDLDFPIGITFGPDGHLYVPSWYHNNSVLKFDGDTGDFLGTFASGDELKGPIQPTFGPDGDLYVSGITDAEVLRYNGTTGQFKEIFASGSRLSRPVGIEFGPDNNLYVVSQGTSEIKRFHGQTGQFIDDFTQAVGLPEYLHFSPEGDLVYVSHKVGLISRYDAVTGDFVDWFITDGSIRDFAFYTIPEPSTLTTAFLAAILLVVGRRRH